MAGKGSADIRERSKKTRFKKGNPGKVPRQEIKPWSVRSCLTYLAGQPLNLDTLDADLKKLSKPLPGKKWSTAAQAVAIRALERAIKSKNSDATNFLTENTEGKLVQPVSLESPEVAPDDNITIEDAQKAYNKFSGR